MHWLYIRGKLLRVSVIPNYETNGIIPIQLVDSITDIEEITKKNIITVYLVMNL